MVGLLIICGRSQNKKPTEIYSRDAPDLLIVGIVGTPAVNRHILRWIDYSRWLQKAEVVSDII